MKKNKIILTCAAIALIITAIATAMLSSNKKERADRTQFMLDTVCTVTLYDWSGDSDEIIDGAFDLCAHYEQLFSATISSSDIYRINHSNGNPTTVDSTTASLISDALEYCRLSEGAFDITILPVKDLWDFSGDTSNIPAESELSEAVKLVDYTKVSVDNCTVTIPNGMGIDLGAIAKGFVADEMANYLRRQNVRSAIIDLGGNIYALGSKPNGSDWLVGIQKPFSEEQAYTVELSDKSAVTSGVYQRYFTVGDKIYHHILNAQSGMPCDSGLHSVTIISNNSKECDALSTICMLLGYEKSIELLKRFPSVEAVFITSDNRVISYK